MKLRKLAFVIFLTSHFGLISGHAQVSIISDDFSSGTINTIKAGNFGSVGLGRTESKGSWTLRGGALVNTGTDPRAVGYIVDLSRLAVDDTLDRLKLRFDYTSANASDSLFVHIYGYQKGGAAPNVNSPMLNLDATKGNVWTNKVDRDKPLKDHFIITNFVDGSAQGMAAPHRGDAASAHEITGVAGAQSIDLDFDLSEVVAGGPTHLSGYDYIALVFARRIEGSSSDTMIDNLSLSANTSKSGHYVDIPEPRSYALLFGMTCFALVVLRRRL